MKLAIISDLHIGEGARSRDLNVSGLKSAPDDNYVENFCSFIASQSLRADFLVVPGDITNRGEVKEFELGSLVVERIAKTLGVEGSRIIFSPGNHDSSWKMIQEAQDSGVAEENLLQYAYLPMLQNGSWIFKRQIQNGSGCFSTSPNFVTWGFENAFFISINTSTSIKPDTVHKTGSVSNEQIEAIDTLLTRVSGEISGKLKVAVIHHHPVPYQEKTFKQPDISTLQNAMGLLEVLWRHNFDVLIHGHKHIPRFNVLVNSIGSPLNVVCAGSFSGLLEAPFFGITGNSFHLLEIHERCGSTKLAKGLLRSWTYQTGHNWIESSERFNSISHLNYFGRSMPLNEAKSLLKGELVEQFKASDVIRWNQLANQIPSLRYIPNKQLIAVLTELASEGLFDMVGIDKGYIGSFEDLTLIKAAAV